MLLHHHAHIIWNTYPTQGVVPGWEYRWLVDGSVVDTDTSAETDTPKVQVDIDWGNYAVGDHVLPLRYMHRIQQLVAN